MLSLVDQNTRVVFIANPNNPTGTWVESETLLSFLDLVPPTTIVVIDEAYYEYCEDPDFPNAIDLLNKYPFLVSTRTFSKIYGLAGMRVGYSVSSPAIADLLNRVRQPFNVNSFGLAAARLALDDAEFLAESRRLNTRGRNRIYAGFSELGLEYIPSTGNFVCVDLARPAKSVHESMLKQGVIVRPVANYGLPNHLRVTVGLPHENEKMIDAMTVALAS
jgi:histidinol-phosphate aminotransferase